MIKWIVIAVAAYILYRLFANDILKKRKKNEKQDEKDIAKKVASGEMVKDPQCGTYVSVEDSITVRDGDKVYHFCSYDCRDKFLKRIADGGQPVAPEDSGRRRGQNGSGGQRPEAELKFPDTDHEEGGFP